MQLFDPSMDPPIPRRRGLLRRLPLLPTSVLLPGGVARAAVEHITTCRREGVTAHSDYHHPRLHCQPL
jgi:hypothetical protein